LNKKEITIITCCIIPFIFLFSVVLESLFLIICQHRAIDVTHEYQSFITSISYHTAREGKGQRVKGSNS
jgi:hypothetical protein